MFWIQHYDDIVNSFKKYESESLKLVNLIEKNYLSMSQHHQSLAIQVQTRINKMKELLKKNQNILDLIVTFSLFEEEQTQNNSGLEIKQRDYEKAKTTIRSKKNSKKIQKKKFKKKKIKKN